MKRFIAGRIEVCLEYDFEGMNKYDAIEKCGELGSEWRLPTQKEIKYLCQNLCYSGDFDFWESTSTIGNLVNRRGSGFNEPRYWLDDSVHEYLSYFYDCQFLAHRAIQQKPNNSRVKCVFLAVRDI
jgi:hypothetical protein